MPGCRCTRFEEVDGVAVAGFDVRRLLRNEAFEAVAARVAAANARYNIGHVTRNFNEPTLALLLFTRTHVGGVAIDRTGADRSNPAAPLVTLRLRGRDGLSLVRSLAGRVTTRGSAVVEALTGVVRQTTVTLSDGVVEATLDTTYTRETHVDLWVPTTCRERYAVRKTGETTTVATTFGNYRKFETSGRIVTEDAAGR